MLPVYSDLCAAAVFHEAPRVPVARLTTLQALVSQRKTRAPAHPSVPMWLTQGREVASVPGHMLSTHREVIPLLAQGEKHFQDRREKLPKSPLSKAFRAMPVLLPSEVPSEHAGPVVTGMQDADLGP